MGSGFCATGFAPSPCPTVFTQCEAIPDCYFLSVGAPNAQSPSGCHFYTAGTTCKWAGSASYTSYSKYVYPTKLPTTFPTKPPTTKSPTKSPGQYPVRSLDRFFCSFVSFVYSELTSSAGGNGDAESRPRISFTKSTVSSSDDFSIATGNWDTV